MNFLEKLLNTIAVFIAVYSVTRFVIWCIVVALIAMALAASVAFGLSCFDKTKQMSLKALFITTFVAVFAGVLVSVVWVPETHIFSFNLLPAFIGAVVSYALCMYGYYSLDSFLGHR